MHCTDFFSAIKTEKIVGKNWIFIIFLFKILIVEVVQTSTHNLCFGTKIRKIGIPL